MSDEPERPSDWHFAYSTWLPEALRYGTITTNDAFRAGYLTAAAETGWKDIRKAPDLCPGRGGIVGKWVHTRWFETAVYDGMRFGYREFNGYTHFRLHPLPPPKPGSGQ